ncbi:MAG: hypothetical protein ACREBQ_14045 [Nitrososphaerales archaeon]
MRGSQIAPSSVSVFNPAFDVTPPELVSAIICEAGIIRKPFGPKINRLKKKLKTTKKGP